MEKIILLPKAFKEMTYWAEEDIRVLVKIFELIKDIQRNPFEGLGKPEPLKHKFKGLWSRRITKEHRLLYKFSNEEITIISCRFYYDK